MSRTFLGEDANWWKPNTAPLSQPDFYVTSNYSSGVTSISVSQGVATDTLLQKGTAFYLNKTKYVTSNQESIVSALATIEFTPATAIALPYRTITSGNVNLATETFTFASHGFMHGQLVRVASFGTVTGLSLTTTYRINKVSNNDFQLLTEAGVLVLIGGTADSVVIAAVVRFSNQYQLINLPRYCVDPKPEFFVEQSHSFEKSQSELITLGEFGFWFKWKYTFNLVTATELSQMEQFLNYANNPKNELWLQPNSAAGYKYRVTLTDLDLEDFYNHSSFEVEFSANFLEKGYPHFANNSYIVRNKTFRS